MSVRTRYLAPSVLVATAGGVVLGLSLLPPRILPREPSALAAVAEEPAEPGPVDVERPIPGGVALRYAEAYQENRCEDIIRLTSWMSDRLRRVSLEDPDPKALDKAREKLCEKILARPFEDNVLRQEGIEDQFVFAPGAIIDVVGKDAGRSDLGVSVHERIWLRVTYSRRETAPLATVNANSSDMKPVRAWTVGVNVGSQGTVLKASVLGNVEVKRETISFDWPGSSG